MNVFLTLWRRELAATFLSPIAYVVSMFFLLVTGFNFYILADLMGSERVSITDVMGQVFGSVLFFWPTFLVLVSALTMRVFAEENRSGTIESLMTAPVTEWAVVLAKFFGVMTSFVFIWLPTVAYAFILEGFSEESVPLDVGPMIGGYVGTALLGMFYTSIGVLASALSRNQIVSAIGCFGLSCLAFFFGFLHYGNPPGFLREISLYGSSVLRQLDFSRGLLDTRPIVLYLSGTLFMLFTTVRVLEARRW